MTTIPIIPVCVDVPLALREAPRASPVPSSGLSKTIDPIEVIVAVLGSVTLPELPFNFTESPGIKLSRTDLGSIFLIIFEPATRSPVKLAKKLLSKPSGAGTVPKLSFIITSSGISLPPRRL